MPSLSHYKLIRQEVLKKPQSHSIVFVVNNCTFILNRRTSWTKHTYSGPY